MFMKRVLTKKEEKQLWDAICEWFQFFFKSNSENCILLKECELTPILRKNEDFDFWIEFQPTFDVTSWKDQQKKYKKFFKKYSSLK